MTHIEQAIRDAAEKGGYAERKDSMETGTAWRNRFILDPAFWQALGKARGWEQENGWSGHVWGFEDGPHGENIIVMNWENAMLDFNHHLAEGKDAESFFKDL